MNALFYKGEDIKLTFSSTFSLAGYTTKAVKFFTPFGTIKTATITAIDSNSFYAKLSAADTADIPSGPLNIVLELTNAADGKVISKTIQTKLADAYIDGSERGATDLSTEIIFIQNQPINVNFSITGAQIADAISASATAVAAKDSALASASAASTSATNAATSASNAASSASAASTSASSASTSATNAANSATAAQTAKTASEAARDQSILIAESLPEGKGYADMTSDTSNSIVKNGVRSFYVSKQSFLTAFKVGSRVRFSASTAPSNYMEGVITAFAGNLITILSDTSGGTGTFASWNLSIAGQPGNVSGSIGQLGFFNTTTSIGGSTDLVWDSVNNRLGIGTPTPLTALTVGGDISLLTTNGLRFYNLAKNNWTALTSPLLGGDNEVDFKISTKTGTFYIGPSGNVGIGSTSLTQTNLRINNNITGNTIAYGIIAQGTVQNDVTATVVNLFSQSNIATNTVPLANYTHFQAEQGTLTGTITNQYGFRVTSIFTGATNNYGFYGSIASGTGRWNLYMHGTANNYLAGNLSIGTTTTKYILNWQSSTNYGFADLYAGGAVIGSTGGFQIWTGATPASKLAIDTSGNVGIGTTSPSTKLEVTGNILSNLSGYQLQIYPAWDTGVGLIGMSSNHGLVLATNAIERMLITSTGNVSIGNTNNTYKLDVTGTTASTQFLASGTSRLYDAVYSGASNGSALKIDQQFAGGNALTTSSLIYVVNKGANPFMTLNDGTNDLFYIQKNGKIGIGITTPSALLDINSDILRLRTAKTPATATATGNQGDICWDASYAYVCVAANTWKRAALTTW